MSEKRTKSNWSDPKFLKNYNREYYKNNKTKILSQTKKYKQNAPKDVKARWNRNWYIRRKARILKILGHTDCERCHEKNLYVLTIHHKDGNYKNNERGNLQVLCANCHLEVEHGRITFEEVNEKPIYDGLTKLWEKTRKDGKNYTSRKNRRIGMVEVLSLKGGENQIA